MKQRGKAGSDGAVGWDELKAQALRELGLEEKVRRGGWSALTAAEAGRLGGWMIRLAAERRQKRPSSPPSL
jgi:hypothetical protein